DLMRQGQYDEAEHRYRIALQADPGNMEAVAGLGQVAVQRGHYSEAVPLLERATRLPSQIIPAFQAPGDAYAATADVDRAAPAYRQAVAMAPENLDSPLSLARSLTDIVHYPQAEDLHVRSLRMA